VEQHREPDMTTMRVTTTDGVALVTIDHPPINLLDLAMMTDLARLEAAVRADDTMRVVVFRSADPEFFIAHADLELIRQLPRGPQPPPTELGFFHALVERWRTLPVVTIAEVDGIARGGGSEFVLSLDLRFASMEGAVFAQPEVALGIIPGGSGTQRLGRFAGRARALEIVLGCDDFDATTAAAYGWVNRALPRSQLRPFVDRLATRIAGYPRDAVRRAKEAVDAAAPAVTTGLLAEQAAWNFTMTDPELDARFDAALAAGAQTRDGERTLDTLLTPRPSDA
jgi:enoyl-CoA hydratase/carnithine racemase